MRVLALSVTALLCAGAGTAQESRGVIFGRITDPSNDAVAGARVYATNVATNTGASSQTNQEGNYEIPLLQPGIYTVTVEMTGFRRAVRQATEVKVDDRLALDIALEVGDVSQSVVVTAETPLLEAQNPSLGMVVDERQVTELPIAGGSAFYLAKMSPGVAGDAGHQPGNPFDLGYASSSIVVNGTRSGSSEVSLDGSSNMSGTNSVFSPPQDMVQEFKIQTLAFDASLGHGTGAIVNVSTKSGTNVLHGSGYFFDSFLRASPWFYNNYLYDTATGPVTEEKKRLAGNNTWLHQRWGGTLGGPVKIPRLYNGRNRTFWVMGYEGMYVRRQPTLTDTVPTAAERAGDFSALLALGRSYQLYDPLSIANNANYTRQPLAGNIIPASQVNPVARKLISYYPLPNAQGTSDGRNNYFRIYDENKDYRTFLARVDHAFSEQHRAFVRFNQSFYRQRLQKLPSLASGDDTRRGAWGSVLDDVLVLTPRSVVNLRYGFTYMNPVVQRYSQRMDLLSLGFPQSLVDQIGTANDPAGIAFPQLTVSNYAALGADGGSTTTTNYHTLSGTLTRLAGNHSLRTGAEARLMRENGYNFGNVTPSFTFDSTYTKGPNQNSAAPTLGGSLAALLYGIPTSGGMDVNASRAEQSTFYAVYLQDDWRLSRRLTVNVGVRYEYEGPTTERYNRTVRGFDATVANPVDARAAANYAAAPIPQIPVGRFRAMGGLTFPGVNGQPRTLWNADANNVAPRVGLAWAAAPRTVVRSGYGIFYGLMGIDRQDVNQGGFNQTTPFVPTNDNGLTYRATLSNPFPDGIKAQTGSGAGLTTLLGQSATFFNPDPRTVYMQRWTFSIQRELLHRLLLEAAYVGNRGTKLAVSRQLNPVPRQYLSTSPVRDQAAIDLMNTQVANPFYGIAEFNGTTLAGARVARSQLLRPYPHFTGVSVSLPAGFSYYHALQVRVQKRFRRGFMFQTTYTYSKFMEATSYLNPTDDRPEKVISNQDYPHRIVLNGILDLPVGRGKRFLSRSRGWVNGILGGWQMQGWYEGQTGVPLGFGNSIFNGDLHNIPLPVSQRSISRWFNVDAGFERASGKQLGQNIRTLPSRFSGVRSDGINNIDLSVFKNFRVTEKLKTQFRTESYNALNHPQFGSPNTTPTSTAFGTVTAEKGHGQRQITFAVKLMF